MAIETLGASHLAGENFEVQRTNNFEIQIDMGAGNDSILTLAVVSGFLPNESNEVITLNYGNTSVTVAGKANLHGSGSLVVRDIIQKDIEEKIDTWRSLVTNKETSAIGLVHQYKKSAKVTQYAPDGTLVRVWDMQGVWPSAVDYGQVSYDSPGVKTITVTLQYDLAKIDDRKEFQKDLGRI